MNLPPTKYFGKTKHIRSLKNYHLSFSYHNSEDKIPKHHHVNPYLSINLGTPYLENNGRSKEIIESGAIVLRSSNYEHQNTFHENLGLCFNIEIISTSNTELLQLFNTKEVNFSSLEFMRLIPKTFGGYLDNELDCLITELFLEKLNNNETYKIPAWYKQIISKVKEDYSSTLTLNELAETVSLHPSYLARKFKKISGFTLGEYIRQIRLENACLMLYSTKRLTDVSLELGFYDQPHFSNTFRSVLDISPRKLRQFYIG